MQTSPLELFRNLTRTRCDCCDEDFVDEVAAMLIWEAVELYADARDAHAERDKNAYAAVRAEAAKALVAARAGRGGA